MNINECRTQDDLLACASIQQDRDLAFVESFSDWLDHNHDALPEPSSFSAWLAQNDDSI